MKAAVKALLQDAGFFPVGRSIYRAISPAHRRDRRHARTFYGKFVRPGDLCFDIGANLGQTIEALLPLGARVVSLEPNPACHPVLHRQFGRAERVTLVHKAVGSAPGKAQLNAAGTASTASMRDDWPFETTETIDVEVITLDSLIDTYGRPCLLKVDVEGFEVEVFKGLSQPIRFIYFEMHRHELERAEQILAHLGSIGEIEGIRVASGDHSGWLIGERSAPAQILDGAKQLPTDCANLLVEMTLTG